MISVKRIHSKYDQICSSIFSKKIKDALEILKELISESGYNDYFIQQEHLESTYEQMLKYTLEGIHDPERKKIYMKLQVSLLDLVENVKAALLRNYSGWHTYILQQELEKKQKLTGKGIIESLDDLAFHSELDEIINDNKQSPETSDQRRRDLVMDIFRHLWLSDHYGEAENSLVKEVHSSKNFSWHEQALQISAILLSALRFFDEQKIQKVIDFIDAEDPQVSGRALVSLVILLYKYDKRLHLYPSITSRMVLLKDSMDLDRVLEQIVLQLIRTEDTLELGKKLHEDIIPEMSKLKPKLEDKLKMEDLQEEDLLGEKNPDWESVFKESDELYKKVDEFMKLQMEGADVYMTTFARLKNFPFFNELTNWLVPFYEENIDLHAVYEQRSDNFNPDLFVSGLKKMPFLCNSDKYSFIFNVKFLPDDQKKMLTTAFNMEIESMSQMISDEELMNANFARRLVFIQHIQDLYRFFKLSPFKNEFEDVFKGKLVIYNSYFFRSIIEDKKIYRNIAEYFFEKEHYDESLDIFRMQLDDDPVNEELIEKAGYCHQKLKQYNKALHYYNQLTMEGKSRNWILRNMGYCYRMLEDYDNAMQVYIKAHIDNPEDARIESLIGFCNMKLGRYDAALKHYFKIEYMNPDNRNVLRPIAWCYFAIGELEKSEKYYTKVFSKKTDYYDYVNFGHLKWAQGDRKTAIEQYLKSTNYSGFDFSGLQRTIDEDIPLLLNAGIEREDIPLMLDYLRYRLK
ncbi:MAG: hypothetical protein K9J30_02465 [Bacteroidales bacterium]|nr:hypothetical protein [Bacteroidales bacterium]